MIIMGAISEEEIELEIDEIAMKVEELSAYSGGMLYKEILRKKLGKQRFKAYQQNPFVKWAEIACTWMYICLTFSFVGFDVVGLWK